MYIEPNSTVKLLKSVPLDTSYRNTVVWDNLTAQVNGLVLLLSIHFLSRVIKELTRVFFGVKKVQTLVMIVTI
jgi:hypothetical protein